MIDKRTIGKIIQNKRNLRKLTQDRLAEIAGISTNHLSKVERGLNNLNAESFLNISKILDLSMSDFGIKIKDTDLSETQKELMNIILSSNDKQNQSYLDFIKLINKDLK